MRVGIEAPLNITLRCDESARIFVGYAPALDIYSQGETREDAIRAIEGAMRMYLITALEVVVHQDGEHQIKANLMPLEDQRPEVLRPTRPHQLDQGLQYGSPFPIKLRHYPASECSSIPHGPAWHSFGADLALVDFRLTPDLVVSGYLGPYHDTALAWHVRCTRSLSGKTSFSTRANLPRGRDATSRARSRA